MRRLLGISLLLLFFFAGAAHPAPLPPRPYSGCGVLTLGPESGADRVLIPFYREPGLLRITEVEGSALPRLSGSGSEPLVAVSERRGGWDRLSYDDAGREGWIKMARAWQYQSWQEFLPGRTVRILPGMKKGYYALRSEPGGGGFEKGSLARDLAVRVLQVEGDWARLQAPAAWFRWRDGDGRLTVSLPEGAAPEKR
jgi:hypothetical protein